MKNLKWYQGYEDPASYEGYLEEGHALRDLKKTIRYRVITPTNEMHANMTAEEVRTLLGVDSKSLPTHMSNAQQISDGNTGLFEKFFTLTIDPKFDYAGYRASVQNTRQILHETLCEHLFDKYNLNLGTLIKDAMLTHSINENFETSFDNLIKNVLKAIDDHKH